LEFTLKSGKIPNAEHLWLQLADCYSKLGDRKNMLGAYSNAIKIKPSIPTLTLRAKEYYRVGDYAAALSDAEAILKKNTRSVDGLFLQAQCLFAQKKYQAALGSVNFVIATYPEMPKYLKLRGEILKKLNRNEEAARDFAKAKQSLQDSGIPADERETK
jgi:tetratricopeptide (TPR) repeat protein